MAQANEPGRTLPTLTLALCQHRRQTTFAGDIDEPSVQTHGISLSFLQRQSKSRHHGEAVSCPTCLKHPKDTPTALSALGQPRAPSMLSLPLERPDPGRTNPLCPEQSPSCTLHVRGTPSWTGLPRSGDRWDQLATLEGLCRSWSTKRKFLIELAHGQDE